MPNLFAIGDAIVDRLNTTLSEPMAEKVFDMPTFDEPEPDDLPRIFVMLDTIKPAQRAGSTIRNTQHWMVMVAHLAEESEVGTLIDRVVASLVGWKPPVDSASRLEWVDPGEYGAGYSDTDVYYFPLLLESKHTVKIDTTL